MLAYLAVTIALVIGYSLLGGHAVAQAIPYCAIGTGAAVVVIVGALRGWNRPRQSWLLLGLSMACWAGGDIAWYVMDLRGAPADYPSVADGAYLVGYLLLAAGLLRMTTAGRARRVVVSDLIDVSIISLCVGLAAWPFVVEPTLAAGWSPATAVSLAYSGGDILLVGVLAALVFNSERRTRATATLGASIAAVFVADVIFYVPTFADSESIDLWSSQAWLIGYLLFGLAGLYGSKEGARRRAPVRHRSAVRRLSFVGFSLLALPAAIVLDALAGDGFGGGDWQVLAAAFVVVIGLIVARAAILIREVEESHARNRRMRARLQTVFDNAGVGIVIGNSHYMTETNAAFQQMLGYTGEELSRLSYVDVVHPDEAEEVRKNLGQPVEGRKSIDRRFIRSDGSTVLARVTHTTAPEDRLHIGVVEDITMKAQQERQRQEGQKLEAIGRLAGGIAHDFNNLLTAVTGHAELIRYADDAAEIEESAAVIIDASARAAALTRQLLTFSRRQELVAEEIETAELLRRNAALFCRVLPSSIRVDLDVDEATPAVVADPTQIDQVLLNLALNARDAMPDGGTLTLGAAAFAPSSDEPRYASIPSGDYCRITVGDTGFGMSETTLARIFEPFYTTKEVGKGTGLGLATTHGIVSRSDGHILVSSKPGGGTTFEIILPASLPAVAAKSVAA